MEMERIFIGLYISLPLVGCLAALGYTMAVRLISDGSFGKESFYATFLVDIFLLIYEILIISWTFFERDIPRNFLFILIGHSILVAGFSTLRQSTYKEFRRARLKMRRKERQIEHS